MEKLNTRLHNENNGLDYVLVGDYYFPTVILAEDSCPVGRGISKSIRFIDPSLAAHRRNSRVRADSNGW